MSQKIYDKVNSRIMELLESGVVPWQIPWTRLGPPRNLISSKPYRGVNLLLLGHHEYESPFFLTFKQARKLGGHVRKGEKGFPVVFWTWVERKDAKPEEDSEERRGFPVMRTYTVFNVEQCAGLELGGEASETVEEDFTPLEKAEQMIDSMPSPPQITHGGDRACYNSLTDEVKLPPRKRFCSAEEYYSTAFHELVHATGHEKRVGRAGIKEASGFGSERYSKEELVAEMGASYLCALAGIENVTLENSAAYIQGWLGALAQDRRLIFQASSAAQKAVDYIVGRGGEKRQEVELAA